MFSSDDIMEDTSSVKVLAFMEIEPLSDKFQQIALTEPQARAMRDALFTILSKKVETNEEFSQFQVITNDSVEVILPNVRDSYTHEFIKTHSEDEEEN